jgi:hypothetical protein
VGHGWWWLDLRFEIPDFGFENGAAPSRSQVREKNKNEIKSDAGFFPACVFFAHERHEGHEK